MFGILLHIDICSQWHSPSSVSEVFGVAHPRPPWLWHRPHLLEASHKSPAWYHTTSSHILCHLFCDIDQFFTLVLTSVWLDGERRENILEMFSRNEKLTQLQKIYLGRISRKSVGWGVGGSGGREGGNSHDYRHSLLVHSTQPQLNI